VSRISDGGTKKLQKYAGRYDTITQDYRAILSVHFQTDISVAQKKSKSRAAATAPLSGSGVEQRELSKPSDDSAARRRLLIFSLAVLEVTQGRKRSVSGRA
jgi:hypothetical protein